MIEIQYVDTGGGFELTALPFSLTAYEVTSGWRSGRWVGRVFGEGQKTEDRFLGWSREDALGAAKHVLRVLHAKNLVTREPCLAELLDVAAGWAHALVGYLTLREWDGYPHQWVATIYGKGPEPRGTTGRRRLPRRKQKLYEALGETPELALQRLLDTTANQPPLGVNW